jgi:hypothetical protein
MQSSGGAQGGAPSTHPLPRQIMINQHAAADDEQSSSSSSDSAGAGSGGGMMIMGSSY